MGEKLKSDRSRLFSIAAELAKGEGFLSPWDDDTHTRFTRTQRRRIALYQEKRMKDWAYELGQIARRAR